MFKRGKGNERERHKSVLRCALLDLTEPPDVNQTSFFDRPPSAREIDSLKVNLIAEIVRADNSLMDKVIRFLKAEHALGDQIKSPDVGASLLGMEGSIAPIARRIRSAMSGTDIGADSVGPLHVSHRPSLQTGAVCLRMRATMPCTARAHGALYLRALSAMSSADIAYDAQHTKEKVLPRLCEMAIPTRSALVRAPVFVRSAKRGSENGAWSSGHTFPVQMRARQVSPVICLRNHIRKAEFL
eukprot:2022747-Rhodomonas_salina.1